MDYIFLFLLWSVYCALHSVLASTIWKRYTEKLMREQFRWYRLLYNLFALAGLVGIIIYQARISATWMFTRITAMQILGWVMMCAGLILMCASIRNYIGEMSGVNVSHKKAGDLKTTGFHKFTRHPLYLGTFMLLWGIWLHWPLLSIFISNCVITVYTVIAIDWEEKKLLQQFGNSYRNYQQRVPKLIPRIRL